MNQVDKLIENLGKKKNKVIVTNLLSSSQCHICHEILNIPMMLSCGHNYCYMCLKSWFKTNENRSLGCPDCRKSVDTTPAFNLFLDHQLKFILNLVKEKGIDSKWDQTLSEREQDEAIFKNDVEKDTLFANVFKNSTLSVVDMDDDGIPRCGNCHWELDPDDMEDDENVCPHCHYRIRNNVTAADSENVMGNSARSIANDLRRRAEEYSEGEYDEIVEDIRRFSDSDLESEEEQEEEEAEHEHSANGYVGFHDNEAIDEDANSRTENEDESEEEHDSEMDSFIENDEADNDEEVLDSEDELSSMRKKRKHAVLYEDDEDQASNNSSEQDSDFYEHNDDAGFVSGDSLDDGSDNEPAEEEEEAPDSDNEEDVGSRKRIRRQQVVLSDDE